MGSCRLYRGWNGFCKSPGRWTRVFSSRLNCLGGNVLIKGQELSRHNKIINVVLQKPLQLCVGRPNYKTLFCA